METASKNLTPELRALRDSLIAYELASAAERQTRDNLVVTWRDIIHTYLKQPGQGDPVLLHKVIDNMDDFLNRAGGRRK
jgi:hypothetical protein